MVFENLEGKPVVALIQNFQIINFHCLFRYKKNNEKERDE